MKIIHIVTALSWRGGEQQVAYLLEELNKQGIGQKVICSRGSVMEGHCQKKGYEFVSVKKGSSFDLGYAWQIRRQCRQFKPDLIHLHDAHAHTFAILAAVVFRNKTPLILSRRVDFPVKSGWLSQFKYNHSSIRKIICVSDEIKRITGASIRDKSKLCTVYSGIDPDKFNTTSRRNKLHSEFGLHESVKIIGNTAAIADHKDYYTFVDTVKVLQGVEEKLKFFIIGDGPDRSRIEQYVRQQGLEQQIIFTGFRKDITEVLPELDIFLMTSKTEGLGTSLLDAMACKIPIVSTNAGGIPEIIHHNENGLLSDIGDVHALAGHVVKLLHDNELTQRLVNGGLKQIESFTKSATAEKTKNVYLSVINAGA